MTTHQSPIRRSVVGPFIMAIITTIRLREDTLKIQLQKLAVDEYAKEILNKGSTLMTAMSCIP